MTVSEKRKYLGMLPSFFQDSLVDAPHCAACSLGRSQYDPELLYVECRICGKPVLWEPGKTTELLTVAGVDVTTLDERCMIVSDGCPTCSPSAEGGYSLAVVRIAGLTPEEAMYMARPAGSA